MCTGAASSELEGSWKDMIASTKSKSYWAPLKQQEEQGPIDLPSFPKNQANFEDVFRSLRGNIVSRQAWGLQIDPARQILGMSCLETLIEKLVPTIDE